MAWPTRNTLLPSPTLIWSGTVGLGGPAMATCTITSESAAIAVTRPASSRRLEPERHFRPRVEARGAACVFMSTLLSAGPRRARRTADDARAEAFIPAD